MSGIYIPGMEMPTRCCDCKLYVEDIYFCQLLKRDIENPWADDGVELDCPLIPVPDHGRLIDAEELPWYLKDVTEIVDAPTIIPADKEAEHGKS